MSTSISTSTSNVYAIMSEPGQSMKNTDSQKAMSIAPDLQRGIQETQQEARKGTTDGYKEALHKINILV